MYLGYNTNGFAFHSCSLALEMIAELGYQSVGLTLDYHLLNPFDNDFKLELKKVAGLIKRLQLSCVIETGARFLLDPRRKHQPTLISKSREERNIRLDFLLRSLEIADELGARALSFWSGSLLEFANQDRDTTMKYLADGIETLLSVAHRYQVPLAFEPEPGMFISRMSDYDELRKCITDSLFGLTLDIGHVHCLEEENVPQVIERYQNKIFNIHIEDMKKGVHDHLMFGDGEIDFEQVAGTLKRIGYQHGVYVELSRHSHIAYETAQRAIKILRSSGFD